MSACISEAGRAALIVILICALCGCGSREEAVGAGTPGAVPASVRQMQQQMQTPPMLGLQGEEEKNAMLEASRITAEAIRKGELPPPEQMQKLPQAQQDAIKRAVEARKGQTP